MRSKFLKVEDQAQAAVRYAASRCLTFTRFNRLLSVDEL